MRIALLFLLPLLLGCSPKSAEEYRTGESEEDIVRLLNERDYGRAIFLIESRNGKRPAARETRFLLAQAYLGKAGFEPLEFSARVSGPQNFSGSEIEPVFPECSSAEFGPGEKVRGSCLLKRIYLQAPDPDQPDLTRARELFRLAYPRADESPEWVNTLIGAVEAASCIKRAGRLYLFATKFSDEESAGPEDSEWFEKERDHFVKEAGEALARAEKSGEKVSRFVSGGNDFEWFHTLRQTLPWTNAKSFVQLIRMLEKK